MAHDHNHHHHTPKDFNLAFGLSVGLNFVFVIIEVGYAFSANSMSLMADAGHNFGDVLGLLLAWGANWLQSRPPTERYSYGYKKTSILAALSNALLIVAAAALIGYESILKLTDVTPVKENIMMIVASIGILINGGTALLFMKGRKADLNIQGAFLHLATDAILSLGVVITGFVIYLNRWHWLDPMVGLVIVATILWSTWGLLRDSVNLILGAVPHDIDHRAIFVYLQNLPHVIGVHDLHIWGLSTKEVALTAHIVMPTHRLSDAERANIHADLLERFSVHHPTLQIEQGDPEHPCAHIDTC